MRITTLLKTQFFFVLIFSSVCIEGQNSSPKWIQVEARPWEKNKPDQKWRVYETQILDSLAGFIPKNVPENIYGSHLSGKHTATGFYRVEKIDNRWWVIDPEGFPNYQRVVNGLRQNNSDRNKAALASTFGTKEVWMQKSLEGLKSYGFNGIGSWSETDLIAAENNRSKTKFSYTVILNFMSSYGKKRGGTYQLAGNIGYPNQCIFVFDPPFEKFCEQYAKEAIAFQADKNLIGYFSDNELPFGLNNLEGYLSIQNPEDAGRLYADNWLKTKGITKDQITDEHRADFAGIVAQKYYSTVSKALKKADPNHLYLGSRLHGGAKNVESIVRAAGNYCDIVSINYYGSWTPKQELMKNWGEWAGKPFMITEFYTKGMDSGMANTTGAGFTVRTQLDRGYAYQHFCLGLLQSPNCVGWHWFKYQDNDPTAKGVDPSNIDSNKGVVNTEYQWYLPLVQKMTQLNEQVYVLIDFFDKTISK
ncbi:MAG: agarase [Bacteroidia bacterium]|nr:agarase [Bacteroidia bacterium]